MTDTARAAAIQKLESCTAADVCDVLVSLKVPHGGFLYGLTHYSPSPCPKGFKVVGPVQTVQFELRKGTNNRKETYARYGLMDQSRPGHVLLYNVPLGVPNANFGGNMALRAHKLGALGMVMAGNFRDLGEMREIGWPLWARGVGVAAGTEVCSPGAMDVPVDVESFVNGDKYTTRVSPGDVVVADEDGVVVVPRGLVEKVAEMAPRLAEVGAKVRGEIEHGKEAGPAAEKHYGTLMG